MGTAICLQFEGFWGKEGFLGGNALALTWSWLHGQALFWHQEGRRAAGEWEGVLKGKGR